MSDLKEDIKEDFKKHRSLFKTARRFDVKLEYVAEVVKTSVEEEKPDLSSCEHEGFGEPDKRRYLVARSLAKKSWDNRVPEVSDARAKFEAGTHIMALGRDGPYLLMYLFPRAVAKPRPNYFTPVLEG